MTLQERLDHFKINFEKSIPETDLNIMHRATAALIDSGIMDGVVKTGETAPDFELKDKNENTVRLKDFLVKGPVVLSFYRGKW